MEHEQHVTHLAREAAAFAAALTVADLDAPVAACSGWTVAELAEHVGAVHRWATLALRTPPDAPAPSYRGSPGGASLVEWYDAGRAALVDTLREAGAHAPCWTMAEPHTAAFWSRRQAHETAVHRWDLEAAAGEPGPIDQALALDGVAEVLDTMLPRQVRLDRIPVTPDWVRLVVDGRELALTTGPVDDRDPAPVATVSGTSEEVLLLLWGRLTPDRLTATGDPAILADFLSRPHVP